MHNRSLVVKRNSNKKHDEQTEKKLKSVQTQIQSYVHNNVHNNLPYDCLLTPFNTQEIILLAQKAEAQMAKAKYAALVIVGIGGSHLCIQAVEQLLHGVFDIKKLMPVYYADTVDADRLCVMQQVIKQIHKTQQQVLLIIISKSGSTIETVANAAVLLQEFSKKQMQDSVICITNEHSLLHVWAQKHDVHTFFIPAAVGGRFSAFTAVGLFPLACMGIDIIKLCEGARAYDWIVDNAALRAEWLCSAIQKEVPIHDLFLDSADAYSLGLWYRQLMGETIGKKRIKDNTICAVGIMPTISLCSADLHSVGQLYIAGPDVRVTTFVTIPAQVTVAIPLSDMVTEISPVLKDKTVNNTLNAIVQGTMQTYTQHNLDFIQVQFPEKSAFYVGQFMYMAMTEMIYLALLLDINPFDQPEVETYKQATRTILAQ